MAEIKAIIFDLEGVIIDSEKVWTAADSEFLRRRGRTYNESEVKPLLMGRSLIEGAAILRARYGLEGSVDELAKEREQIATELFKNSISFIDGFSRFFDTVKDRYATAVATSLARGFFRQVDTKMHLTEMFGGRIYSIEDIGFVSKPDPAIFLHAAKQIGVAPENCLVIEDSPNGVEAAKRAGMMCAAITTTTPREKLLGANWVVDSYPEMHAVVLAKSGRKQRSAAGS